MTDKQPFIIWKPDDLAEQFQVSLRFVKKHIQLRNFPGMIKTGHLIRFDANSVLRHVHETGRLLLSEPKR